MYVDPTPEELWRTLDPAMRLEAVTVINPALPRDHLLRNHHYRVDGLALSEYAARVCYNSLARFQHSVNFLVSVWDRGHHDVFEHSAAVFVFEDVNWERLALYSNHLYLSYMDSEGLAIGANMRAWADLIQRKDLSSILVHQVTSLLPVVDGRIQGDLSTDRARPMFDPKPPVRLDTGATVTLLAGPGRIASGVGHEDGDIHFYTVELEGVSRSLTHQLVRHRLASFSQRSQRYVEESEARFVTPPELVGSPIYDQALQRAWEAYMDLRRVGRAKEDARFVLPSAAQTRIVVTMPVLAWRHFLRLRTASDAQWEIRAVAQAIQELLGLSV